MKRHVFTLLMILASGVLFAQTTSGKVQDVKIKYSDKSNLKKVEKSNGSSASAEKSEPTIIQSLEYKNPDVSSDQVQPVEEKTIEDKVETGEVNSTEKQMIRNSKSTPEVKTVEEQIEILEGHIKAIDTKVESVMNNPETDKKAKDNGWYVQMANNKKDAIEKKEALINSKK